MKTSSTVRSEQGTGVDCLKENEPSGLGSSTGAAVKAGALDTPTSKPSEVQKGKPRVDSDVGKLCSHPGLTSVVSPCRFSFFAGRSCYLIPMIMIHLLNSN